MANKVAEPAVNPDRARQGMSVGAGHFGMLQRELSIIHCALILCLGLIRGWVQARGSSSWQLIL